MGSWGGRGGKSKVTRRRDREKEKERDRGHAGYSKFTSNYADKESSKKMQQQQKQKQSYAQLQGLLHIKTYSSNPSSNQSKAAGISAGDDSSIASNVEASKDPQAPEYSEETTDKANSNDSLGSSKVHLELDCMKINTNSNNPSHPTVLSPLASAPPLPPFPTPNPINNPLPLPLPLPLNPYNTKEDGVATSPDISTADNKIANDDTDSPKPYVVGIWDEDSTLPPLEIVGGGDDVSEGEARVWDEASVEKLQTKVMEMEGLLRATLKTDQDVSNTRERVCTCLHDVSCPQFWRAL